MPQAATTATEPVRWPGNTPPVWSGVPQRPLLEVLQRGVDTYGDRPVLLFDDGFSVTSAEIWTHTAALAGYLRTVVSPGDRVALAMGNSTEHAVAFLAVVAVRATVVSLAPETGPHEAAYAVADSRCRVAICDAESAPVFQALVGQDNPLEAVLVSDGPEPTGFAHLGSDPLDLRNVDCQLEDLVDIGYTSGTTGLPKALGGRHPEILRYLDVSLRFRATDTRSPMRLLMPLQMHYGDPLTALFSAIVGGHSLVLMRRFSARRFWDVARTTGATDILTIGSIPDMLLSRPEGPADRDHCIRSAIALAIPPNRHAELERRFGFPWREVYGSSETGPAIAMPTEVAAQFVGTGALGIPYPEVDARLVDHDGAEVIGAGTGELEVQGPVRFEGYLDNPEASAEVNHDGWLRTGDVLRRDERGVYYFEGRRKELIRRSGINVAPAEVEAVLRLHPDVLDAAVVPVPDPMMGEEIKAYVQLTDSAAWEPAVLADFVGQHLARQKVPRYFEHRLEPFPRTTTQRIPKNQLKVDGEHLTATAWDRTAQAGAR